MKNPWVIVVLVWALAIGWGLGSPALFMMAHSWLSGVYRWAGMGANDAGVLVAVLMIILYLASVILGGIVAAVISGEALKDE